MTVIDKQCKFMDFINMEERNCFEGEVTDIIYFPVKTTPDFPTIIMEKVNSMISNMMCTYQRENNCTLDIAELHIDARLENFINVKNEHQNIICIVITSNTNDEVWIEEVYDVLTSDPLYKMFKGYFMKQLEQSLFG